MRDADEVLADDEFVRDDEALERQKQMDAEADAMLASMPPVRVMRAKLRQAQQGDDDALRLVAQYVYARFIKRLNKFRVPIDPAYERADLDMVFFEAILKFVPHADGRGDDFYHIGQRGYWAVQTWLRSVGSGSKGRSFQGLDRHNATEDGSYDLLDTHRDPLEEDFTEAVCERDENEHFVLVLDGMTLNGREKQALALMRSGAVGDPNEKGFRKDLAARMGVSPQRVSQILSGGPTTIGLMDKLEAALEA